MRGGFLARDHFETAFAKLRVTPRAAFKRDGRGIATAVLSETLGLDVGGFVGPGTVVTDASKSVGCCCGADPETNLEGPLAKNFGMLPALQFHGANQCCGATELVECEQAQRVAHQDTQSGGTDARVGEATENHLECGQSKIGLGFAAPGREEQEFHESELQKAKEKIAAKYPDKEIILVYAKLSDDKENIEFITLA